MKKAMMNMAKQFLTPDNITKLLSGFAANIKARQDATGQKYVLTLELTPDGENFEVKIWNRGENNQLELVAKGVSTDENITNLITQAQNATGE